MSHSQVQSWLWESTDWLMCLLNYGLPIPGANPEYPILAKPLKYQTYNLLWQTGSWQPNSMSKNIFFFHWYELCNHYLSHLFKRQYWLLGSVLHDFGGRVPLYGCYFLYKICILLIPFWNKIGSKKILSEFRLKTTTM